MALMEVTDRIQEIVDPYLREKGLELVEMLYRREGAGMVLRLLVDRVCGGISVAECEELNHFLGARLDEENIMEERYFLEVSSPGLDSPLKTDRDYARAMGCAVAIDTALPVDGMRHIEGLLIGASGDSIVVESRGVSTLVPKDAIVRAKRKIEV